jgi:hypothetical protein
MVGPKIVSRLVMGLPYGALEMMGNATVLRGYDVTFESLGHGRYRVSCRPRTIQHERGLGGSPKKVSVTIYRAELPAREDAPVTWESAPAETEEDLAKFDDDVRRRAVALHAWLETLSALVATVQQWATDLGWSTKLIEKPMDDSEIGKYTAPALLLQEETTRVLLEPIARRTPRSEGVVDLYLMPAYEDIASLYYSGRKWHLHYTKSDDPAVAAMWEAASKPLTKTSLRQVLEAMKTHAG